MWTALRATLATSPHTVSRGGRIVDLGAEPVRNGLTGHAVDNATTGGVHEGRIRPAQSVRDGGNGTLVAARRRHNEPGIDVAQRSPTCDERPSVERMFV